MRRARIKVTAALPVRKKSEQDTIASADINNVPDEAHKVDKTREEPVKDTVDSANINNVPDKTQKVDKTKEEPVKDVTKVGEETIKEKQNKINLTNSELVIAKKLDTQELCSQSQLDSKEPCAQAKLDSQEQHHQINNKPDEVVNQTVTIQKSVLPPDVPTATDIVSPTKVTQNRSCFMRPTPRLDSGGRVRKNSIQGSGASASESEDEHGKKTISVMPNRIRNDSICSVQSNKESTNDSQNNSPRIKTMQKRRMIVSESARRLAEARREFSIKHENKTPDRAKLKMYDLIYYNPVTNPMKKSAIQVQAVQRRETTPLPVEVLEEEDVDDPSAVPAPQVKVGPDGQLIIDEQSLVIEQTNVKKGRDLISNDIIIEDENNRTGGFYKKHKRSKDWPNWETFKFYRVLNVVGTDFLLMQTHFPNRTRQEIKQKYKKEERVNRHLVEKALKYHQEFDTEMLEEQLAMLKKLENIQDPSKKASEMGKNGKRTKTSRKLRHRLVAESIGECEASSINDQEAEDATISTISDEIDSASMEANGEASNTQRQMKKENKARKWKRRLDDMSDKSDTNSSHASSNADSESDPEVYRVRPTRSGRLPIKKMKKLQGPDVNTLDSGTENESSVNNEIAISSEMSMKVTEDINTSVNNGENTETPCPENIETVIPNINQIEPGSLVIVSKESAEDPGNTILQVYMVSSNIDNANAAAKPNIMPVDLPSELLMTVTNKLEDTESVNTADDCEK